GVVFGAERPEVVRGVAPDLGPGGARDGLVDCARGEHAVVLGDLVQHWRGDPGNSGHGTEGRQREQPGGGDLVAPGPARGDVLEAGQRLRRGEPGEVPGPARGRGGDRAPGGRLPRG